MDPNYAVAYQYYGYALFGMGRGEEGIVAMKHAAELDPVSPSVQTSLAWGYFLLRRRGSSVDQCKRVLELYPDLFPPTNCWDWCTRRRMRIGKSMAELTRRKRWRGIAPSLPC